MKPDIFNKFIVISLLVFSLLSCYKDYGNYDYNELNEISITGIEESYVVEQFENFTIQPVIEQADATDETNLEFLWHMYPDNRLNNSDTLSTERDLNATVFSTPGYYKAICRVTDGNTGVFVKKEFSVQVVNTYSNGLMILSELNNNANIAFLNSAGSLYEDVYYTVNKVYAGKNPVGLGLINNRFEKGVLIMCDDGKGGAVVDALGFEKYAEYNDLFWIPKETPKPSWYCMYENWFYSDFIIDNGLLRHRNLMNGAPVKCDAETMKGTELFPAMFNGWIMSQTFYDQKSERFIVRQVGGAMGVVNDMPAGLFNPADLKMQMICGADGFKGDCFAMVYDDESNKYYSIQFICDGTNVNPLSMIELSSAVDLDKASSFAVSSLSPQYFYAVENKLYCLDALANVNSLVYEFDAGVTIDHIELKKEEGDRVMFVGTSQTASDKKIGSIHFMDVSLNGGLELTKTYPNMTGKVVDFLYK